MHRDSPECNLGQLFGFWSASFPGGVSLFMGEEGQSLNMPCSNVNWGKKPTEFTESKILLFANNNVESRRGFKCAQELQGQAGTMGCLV